MTGNRRKKRRSWSIAGIGSARQKKLADQVTATSAPSGVVIFSGLSVCVYTGTMSFV